MLATYCASFSVFSPGMAVILTGTSPSIPDLVNLRPESTQLTAYRYIPGTPRPCEPQVDRCPAQRKMACRHAERGASGTPKRS